MIKAHKITEMLYDKCQKVVVKPSEWVCRCPICGDSTTKPNVRRFHINWYPAYNTYMYKCHRCGDSNNVYMLCSKLYDISYVEAKKWLDDVKYNPIAVKKAINKPKIKKEKIKTTLNIDIKRDCYSVNDIPSDRLGIKLVIKLKKFIKKRQLKETCYIGHVGKYKGRIIIPVINDNHLLYFQARSLYKEILPKYLNPIVNKTPIIYHKNEIKKTKNIILVEGLIDAMTVGKNCTSTLGADVSDEKLSLLFKLTNKTVIICMDNDDAGIKSLKKVAEKSKFKKIVKYFLMPKEYKHIKDMNDLFLKTEITDLERFINDNVYSYFYIKTLFRLC